MAYSSRFTETVLKSEKKSDQYTSNFTKSVFNNTFNSTVDVDINAISRQKASQDNFPTISLNENKSILKTISAGTQYLGQGALKGLEGVFVDTPLIMASGVKKLFGDEEGAKTLMEASDVSLADMLINYVSGNETNPYINGNQNLWNREVDKNSYIKQDNFGGKVISGIGEMLPTIAIGGGVKGTNLAKKAASNVLLGSKAFSGATNEAYRDSGDIGKSMLYGLGSAGVELATEQISGGIPGLKQINGNTKREILKNYAKSAIGEGVEEVTSSLVNPLLQTTYKGSEALNQYKDKDYWKDVLESGLVGTTIGGVLDSPNTIHSIRNNRNLNNKSTGINDLRVNNINTPVEQNTFENGLKGDEILHNQDNIKNSLYQFEQTNNQKINKFRESAVKYNFNNTSESHNMFNTIEKIMQDKDYNVIFDNTIKNKSGNPVNAQIRNENGEIEIRINPNSNRAGEFLLTHEITHAIETDSMKQLVMDYASKNSEFNQSLKGLKQVYGTNEVSDEVLADISGQLFGNQEFINNLSLKEPNIFKRFYNKIVELANKITGNSKESLFIKDLKNKWEIAYRNTTNEQAVENLGKNKFSIQQDMDGNKYVNVDTNQEIFEGKNLTEQTKIAKQYILDNFRENGINANNENINITSKTANEYTHPKNQLPTATKSSKMKASTELDNLLSISKYQKSATDDGRHSFAKDGWDYYETTFKVGDNLFTGLVNIGKNGNKKTLYDITNIKRIDQNRSTSAKAFTTSLVNSTIDNISQSNENVNSNTSSAKYSMQNNENNTQELDNSSFSLEQRVSGDGLLDAQDLIEEIKSVGAKVDKNGYVTLYHQTTNENADKIKQSGKMFAKEPYVYFSTSESASQSDGRGNIKLEFKIPAEKLILDDIFDDNADVKIKLNSNKELDVSDYIISKNRNSISNNHKQKQLDIIKNNNPVNDDYHTWIRNVEDIKTLEETINDSDWIGYDEYNPDLSRKDIENAIESGKIIVYSSYPVEQGIFVSPSRMEAESYSGNGKVYSKEVNISDVAWIDPTQGQYAKVNDTRYSQQNNKWQTFLEKNFKATGTRTNMNSIRKGNMILANSDTRNNIEKESPLAPRAIPKDPTKESSYDFKKTKTRKQVQAELLQDMGITLEDISIGKDIASVDMSRTDPIRLNEKVFGYKVGQKINDATINKTKHNESEKIRWLNNERKDIESLGIKPRSKESEAVQKYGEKQYVTKNNEVIPYGDYELAIDFPDVKVQEKIKNAAKVIRNKYDNYIDNINGIITEMGYNPINKRKDYMRHFEALSDLFSKYGLPLNRQSMMNDALPTDINGLTDQFKPGKNFFTSAMERFGMKTSYDAISGIDGYLEGAGDLIYHTEDIQRYRALSKFIRDTYGSQHGFDDYSSMTSQEQAQRYEDIRFNKLSKYAAWLDEQANTLAGKKGKIDRGVEETFGRKIYTICETAKKQVGSNMTGFNVRSALTNFASAIQGASKTNKIAFIKGTISSVNNIIHNDDLVNKSDFLTSRFGSKNLSQKLWQKVSNAGQIFMEGSDYFTANQIWRSKYFENLSKGMTENQAIKNADDFSARIMGDRSKGATAALFNSKTAGFLTQFQLEVNNQWSSLIHDNKIDIQSGNKTGATVVFQLGQLAAMSYLFNNFMKSVTGSAVMIDPIDLLKKIFNPDDDKDIGEKATEVLGDVLDDMPFASIFNGGRIPVGEAFKGGTTLFKTATNQTDSYGNKYKWSDVKDDIIESSFYWLLPTGYGQMRKSIKGAQMYSGKLPTAGSYTKSGNLRFSADESTKGKIKAVLFGQYSSEEAQKYVESGYKTISKNKIQEMKDLNMTSSEYKKFSKEMTDATKTTDSNNYKLYTDGENNYWYDESNGKVYDSNYRESSKAIQSLKKVSSKQLKFDYINSLNLNNEMKNKILNSYYGGNVTDSYGYTKYVKKGKYIYSSDGLQKYKNESGTVYWVNKKTGAIYNSSGKLAKKISKSKLTPATQDLTYWYDDKNNQLYDSNYNKVDNSIISSLDKETKDIDINVYNDYSSYDEYKYVMTSKSKYNVLKNSKFDYSKYQEIKKEISNIKEKSSNKKTDVFKYINKLPYSKGQKIILFKMAGGYDVKAHKNELYNYINGLKLSKREKEEMWKEIYGG